jgi:malonate-semialdehyde dehydrogenase (acetylating)/methylmalonate-semialdehyde dehydrogenase
VPSGGFFLGATLIDHVEPNRSVYQDEILGPVPSVMRREYFDEAIELINANPLANGTAVFTRDRAEARKFEQSVNVGMVGINVPIPVPVVYCSFAVFTRGRVVTSRWPDPATSTIDLRFPQNR